MYDVPDDRPTLPVNGAYGGPSMDGSVVFAHVYMEFGTIPAMEEHEADEAGVVDLTKGNVIKRGDLTRKVLATLVLPPEAAIRLGGWLVTKGGEAKQRAEEGPPK
ncbi:MAG: hypothetical protein ACREA0_06200 [bacterium]